MHGFAQQDREGNTGFLGLLRHQWQLPLLSGHQAFLLSQLKGRGRACVIAGLDHVQDALGVGQVEPRNAQLLVIGQGLHVAAGDAAEQGQLDGGLVKLAGIERVQGAVTGCGFAAPKVHFVAGRQVGVKVVQGLVVVGGIQLAVTLAAQQFFTVGAAGKLHFGEPRGASNNGCGAGLLHAGNGCGQVVTADSCLSNQTVQGRATKMTPPLLAAQLAGLRVGRLPGRGRLHRVRVARRGLAARAQQQARGQQTQRRLHQSIIHW